MSFISCEPGRTTDKKANVVPATLTSSPVSDKFHELHEQYKETSITNRRFKHADVVRLLEELQTDNRFDVKKIGQSYENRDIYLVKIGTGKTTVLMWSQMHGDEPTATMALMDIFNYLRQTSTADKERDEILKQITLYVIPMLNPDGAEVYKRRNALDVDLNRDAISLQSPESRLLKSVRDSLKPEFGFNLHDQNTRYTAGKNGNPATISFLAPPYNYAKSVNEVRGNAMKLIVRLNKTLQLYIPNQVAKYSDEHEPRAFGDNIQKWGTSVVLIESGGYKNDPEKQYIRKLNFVALLTAMQSIATQSYARESIEPYYEIPQNERYLYDLVIRNVEVPRNSSSYKADIGINRYETTIEPYTNFYYRSLVEEIGDMSVNYGYQELDATGMRLVPGKVYPKEVKNVTALKTLDVKKLLQQGYTHVRLSNYLPPEQFTNLPINILSGKKIPNNDLILNRAPNFVLEQNGEVRYAVINGFVYDVQADKNGVINALVNQ
ncbi:M14 family zinc carboxypeptidase [Rhodocytophaga aerolata]|uniref:M14 family zinc carboxypeptidase n=1 Tax=Rhodocytophaga aerolata TaxID=455078 RepID=A0ABT8R5E5_9BACT|nr:M14 family zinc carboxypeptidase [Rhodocytophaga aerolata]MDO1445992.1 M14 family zinc carboxypeptidase [Rhodocytophaga aerolata]